MAKREFAIALNVLADAGGELTWSAHDYEAFRFAAPGVRLIFYPHTTSSTGNVSIRVRDSGSKDKKRAAHLMALLYIGAGNNNTFSWKGMNFNSVLRIKQAAGIEYGWAEPPVNHCRARPRNASA
ncbi:hypothetical protein WS71_20095 [Burkholderia mayonis]|uniref:Uncharacterized protein n=2 Tax=Burkholderia mayonis TaxID=1385591 RepID=A0A1B4G132_9BURK|nr:hypothetical protein WS71_20095 [Burkholderia mayonis]KVE52243.1 hypothetical protein WS71_09920 [Burkholderia mayonis]